MPRRVALLLTLPLALTVLVGAAWGRSAAACDCGRGEPTVAEAKVSLAIIVDGRVRSIRPGSTRAAYTAELFVIRAWKGATAGTTVAIPIEASSCGYVLVPGDEVLIYAPAGEPVAQCAGDRTARVRLGPGIAADATALGPPASTAVEPARTATPAELVADAVVLNVTGGSRQLAEVRVTRARRGAKRYEVLQLWSPIDGCAVAAELAVGDRIALAAHRLRDSVLPPSVALVSSCDVATKVRVVRPARRPAARRTP